MSRSMVTSRASRADATAQPKESVASMVSRRVASSSAVIFSSISDSSAWVVPTSKRRIS